MATFAGLRAEPACSIRALFSVRVKKQRLIRNIELRSLISLRPLHSKFLCKILYEVSHTFKLVKFFVRICLENSTNSHGTSYKFLRKAHMHEIMPDRVQKMFKDI